MFSFSWSDNINSSEKTKNGSYYMKLNRKMNIIRHNFAIKTFYLYLHYILFYFHSMFTFPVSLPHYFTRFWSSSRLKPFGHTIISPNGIKCMSPSLTLRLTLHDILIFVLNETLYTLTVCPVPALHFNMPNKVFILKTCFSFLMLLKAQCVRFGTI